MKNKILSILMTLFITLTFTSNTLAKNYTKWDLPENAIARIGKGWTNEFSYSPDGTKLAVAGSFGIWIYDAQTGEELDLYFDSKTSYISVSFSPDGKTLAGGSHDKTIRLWNTDTDTHIRTLKGHTDYVNTVSFSPDGKTIASGSYDKTVRLWNSKTGSLLRTLEGHLSKVNSVSFSPDGKTIASASRDYTIRLWGHKDR